MVKCAVKSTLRLVGIISSQYRESSQRVQNIEKKKGKRKFSTNCSVVDDFTGIQGIIYNGPRMLLMKFNMHMRVLYTPVFKINLLRKNF